MWRVCRYVWTGRDALSRAKANQCAHVVSSIEFDYLTLLHIVGSIEFEKPNTSGVFAKPRRSALPGRRFARPLCPGRVGTVGAAIRIERIRGPRWLVAHSDQLITLITLITLIGLYGMPVRSEHSTTIAACRPLGRSSCTASRLGV